MGKPALHIMPSISLPAVVMIAAGAFILGHLSKHAPQADRGTKGAAALQGSHDALREMGELGDEFLESSGIMRLRPPLQPAASGIDSYVVQPFQILSWYPRIVVYPNFIDAERCDHIVKLAEGKLRASGLAWRPDEKPVANQETRTSYGTFLDASEDGDGVLQWLEEKIAAVTLLPRHHGEAFNVLRYRLNAKYDSHMDIFDPKDFGPQPSQRMATVLTYLSDVQEGGETIFKKEGKDNADVEVHDYVTCEPDKFKYKPRKGDAVLFFSLDPDLNIDPRSLHGGCPVTKGEKWVATKWIHEKPFRPAYDS